MIKQATRPKPAPTILPTSAKWSPLDLAQQTIAIDRQTIDKLSRLVSLAQADNNALRANLAAMRERLAVVEAKVAIQAAILAGQDEAIRELGMRWVEKTEVTE
jgi:uncharacterized coiled-coil protein SlyX